MKKQSIFILIVVVVIIVSLLYSFMGGQDQTAYIEQIQKERDEKEQFMRTSEESPFASNKNAFQGLKYYPVDVRYKITADLKPVQNKEVVLLRTNDGKEQRYVKYAYAEFDLDGFHNKLLILEMIDMGPFRGKLFLAFGDETSARETYGAGRYLDVTKVQGSNTITLDFNMAYNPYCAYADEFSCPLPPAENLLKVAIRAGEKVYHN
ncbi:DUF1684 domain-containing protein [Ohtaekwangia sp.]|uniref:DUF1684 domain-containing protein n=1 Tax=Ohtaekwangia sp. TaxID=2066019 RepID=UPI002FDE50D8